MHSDNFELSVEYLYLLETLEVVFSIFLVKNLFLKPEMKGIIIVHKTDRRYKVNVPFFFFFTLKGYLLKL